MFNKRSKKKVINKILKFHTPNRLDILKRFEKSPIRADFSFTQAIINLMKDYLKAEPKSQ